MAFGLVIEWRGSLVPIEIKTKRRPSVADARHIRSFLREYPEMSRAGLVLHTGVEVFQLAEGRGCGAVVASGLSIAGSWQVC